MPLCGFNQKMLDGLKSFNEGLVEYGLEHRSQLNGETIDQAIRRELADMNRLLLEIGDLDDAPKRVITEGLVKYAMGFYLLIRKHGIKDSCGTIDRITQYFEGMDSKYYSELEGGQDDMRQLVKYLNSLNM